MPTAIRLHFCNPTNRQPASQPGKGPSPQSHRPVIIHILLSSHSSEREGGMSSMVRWMACHGVCLSWLHSAACSGHTIEPMGNAVTPGGGGGVRSNSSGRR